ncbi:GNAT family N-acetyltransferase [Microbacterium sp. NC79]|uniref:GNAT family N-acetyltransferase n=1 Tax=Microbacterium sp. NC79 TaxID=2851009 RepID=UPI001C2BA9A2|nr:GNAT family N-acetyltransferase [Microbacterium sp. NC79]MBV0893675.1 GNAT family N-acetyltransferase [Microbacterium sp. NC79]
MQTQQQFESSLRKQGLDAQAAAALASRGLELRLIPTPASADDIPADPTISEAFPELVAVADWFRSLARGFLDAEPDEKNLPSRYGASVARRNLGVFDADTAQPQLPVGTFGSFVTELTVPGEAVVPAFAITAVSVAATHRRRGIARQLMEGELRAAVAAGLPVAVLTVSESSIYQRYGFAPSASAATWVIDRKRAGFSAPATEGRVDYISREQFRELAPVLHERIRLTSPGEIIPTPMHWDRFAGLLPGGKNTEAQRFVQYRDAAGDVQGLIVYSLREHATDYSKTGLDVSLLMTATDDAYAAMWRYLFEHDLIGDITLELRSVDEPVRWMLADQRAATVTVVDHQYVRILDVAAALQSRTYGSAGRIVFDVTDPLGLGGGRFALDVNDAGRGVVTRGVADEPDVKLSTVELSALFIGGTSAQTLVSAGRLSASGIDVVSLVDAMFRTPTEPRLSFWY